MPTSVVKTKKQERAWEKAKRIVRQQYPKVEEGSKQFWRLVMTIYKMLSGYKPKPKQKKGRKYKILYRD